ncbi:unnamed protein product [Brachionus calyciflorus]|uniref:Uncharacterized protein n=1 Tax=Brachionus calyciflorus TaxID=104777 RepID=A0A813YG76_9BILA|nr:unnamed protein product [Brachionus calyciflorus]
MPRTQIYVGNLDRDISRREVENTFDKYGKMLTCEIKSKGNAPSYAFIDFEDPRDAEDALRSENGKELRGRSMVIEWAKTKDEKMSRESRYGRNGFSRGGRGERSLDCYDCGRRGHFAKDCPDRDRDRRRSDRDRRDRDRDDRRDRRRSRSRSRRRSRSASPRRRSRSRSDSRRRSKSRSRSNQRRSRS